MKTCVIINRTSGAAEASGERIRQLATSCADCKAPIDAIGVRDSVQSAARDGCQRIIVAGGDGTISLATTVLIEEFPDVELALLPLGTGNDFARSLGLAINNVDLAFRQAIDGKALALDVGEARWTNGQRQSQTCFINVANGALSGLVAHDVVAEDKARWGAFAYWMTALGRLVDSRDFQISVELDEQVIDFQAYGVLVANGRFVGGGFPAAPYAAVDDGLFDVVLIPVLPTLDLVGAGLDFWLGSEQVDERIHIARSRRVRIHGPQEIPFSMDGETTTARDATFEVRSRAVRFVVGDDPPAIGAGDH